MCQILNMTQNIILSPISLDELEQRLVDRFKTELANTANKPPQDTEEDFLTAKEVTKLLGVSLVTLHNWRRDGKIKFHRFGSRIRFVRSEILNNQKFGGTVK